MKSRLRQIWIPLFCSVLAGGLGSFLGKWWGTACGICGLLLGFCAPIAWRKCESVLKKKINGLRMLLWRKVPMPWSKLAREIALTNDPSVITSQLESFRSFMEGEKAFADSCLHTLHDYARLYLHSTPEVRKAYCSFRTSTLPLTEWNPNVYSIFCQTLPDLLACAHRDVRDYALTELGSLSLLGDRNQLNVPDPWRNMCFAILEEETLASMKHGNHSDAARLIEHVAWTRRNPAMLAKIFTAIVECACPDGECHHQYIQAIVKCLEHLSVDALHLSRESLMRLQRSALFRNQFFLTNSDVFLSLFAQPPETGRAANGRVWRRFERAKAPSFQMEIRCGSIPNGQCPRDEKSCAGHEFSLGGFSSEECSVEENTILRDGTLNISIQGKEPVCVRFDSAKVVRCWLDRNKQKQTAGRGIEMDYRGEHGHVGMLDILSRNR